MFNRIKKNLDEKGYHTGIVSEFYSDMDRYYEAAREVRTTVYKHTLRNNGLVYTSCIHGPKGNLYPREIKYNEKVERQRLIEDNHFIIDQQWTFFGNELLNFYTSITEDLLFFLYPDLKSNNIKHNKRFTLYEDGDFTDVHIDGLDHRRKCAILLYLSDAEDYKDGGGKLLLTKFNSGEVSGEVLPVFPNYIIIDIEKHQLYHGVEKVKNGFKRFAFLDFVSNEDLSLE